MNLDNTRKMLDKQKQQLSRVQTKIDSLEKQAREMEDANIVKIVRQVMTYDEFIKIWSDFQKEKAEVSESLKKQRSEDEDEPIKINPERTDVRSEYEENS